MGRKPDEIKLGLECCIADNGRARCEVCPYGADGESFPGCMDRNSEDALARIQQLERERDAAVELLYDLAISERTFCDSCVYNNNPECCAEQKVTNADCWEWRGVQEVE